MNHRWNDTIREAMEGFFSPPVSGEQRRLSSYERLAGKRISGVVLAAGFSARAGMFKLTCMLEGMTVIERCIQGMLNVCDEIIMVGGYECERLQFLPSRYEKVRLVYNPDYTQGVYTSIRKGLSEACGYQVFITPGDCPLIPESVYRALLSIGANAVVPCFSGMSGHPILLSRPAVNALLVSRHDSFRVFLRAYGYVVLPVEEPSILFDLDTPEDYDAILTLLRIRQRKTPAPQPGRKPVERPIS